MKWLGSVLMVATVSSADAGDWGPWPIDNPYVAAGFEHDDGGKLLVLCDSKARFISLVIEETRANYQQGASVALIIRSDAGNEVRPSGIAMNSKTLIIKEEATFGIWTMGQATKVIVLGDGTYARIFPAANFRKAVEPVLRACGDHW
jgi:hypothetical protein